LFAVNLVSGTLYRIAKRKTSGSVAWAKMGALLNDPGTLEEGLRIS
jgi:hypothetical protein